LFNSRQYTSVPEYADKALALDPSFTEVIRMKAVSFYALKEYQNAIDNYRQYEAIGSLSSQDYQYFGKSFEILEMNEEAVVVYEKAIASDSTLTLVMNDAGTLFMKMKRWEEAARMFEARYTHDSTAVTAYINYAQCMLVLERFEEASSSLEIAIAQKPDYIPSYIRLGIAYLQMKDYPTAKTWFEKTIEVIDTNTVKYKADLAQAYRYIGLVLLLDKKWDLAIKNLRTSLTFDKKDESTLLWLAQGLQNAQKKDEAIKYYKEVLKVNKKNEQALKGLEVLQENSG
jgi:tetratricopeptide (TPR) repeat protein